jgi:hypothetical protein
MTSKFEQLIEYVINDEEAKAKELFHDIVVEKSREIYENLMNEEEDEELDEESHDEKADDRAERDAKKVKKDLEYDYKHGRKVDENLVPVPAGGMEEEIGGDASDDLIDDVESEEQGMQEAESDAEFDDEAEEDGEDMTKDMEHDRDEGNEGDIEDRVIDLEDKLDELMAEFEAIMGGEDDGIESDLDGEMGDELAGDALAQDDTMAFADDEAMMENITLDKVAVPKMGDDGANTKSVVPANSGARGMAASPVKMTGDTAQGRPAPKTGDLPQAGTFKNVPGKGGSNSKLSAAPKPTTTQAAGTNTRTPFPKG